MIEPCGVLFTPSGSGHPRMYPKLDTELSQMLTSGVMNIVGDPPLPIDLEQHEEAVKAVAHRIGTGGLSVDTPFSSKLSMATQYCCPTVSARSSSVVPWSWKRWYVWYSLVGAIPQRTL